MSDKVAYKQRKRQDRNAVLETDFSKGMMYSDGTVDEGYVKTLVNFTYEKETGFLIPRPGLALSSIIFPDVDTTYDSALLSNEVSIKDHKECVEGGITYDQIILGKLDAESETEGIIWVNTSLKPSDSTFIEYDEDFSDDISYAEAKLYANSHKCFFYTVGDSSVHKVPLAADAKRRIAYPVGSFAFGNSYYFFGKNSSNVAGLFRTKFDGTVQNRFIFEAVTPKECSVSEAVTYGYNMLLGSTAYTFNNQFTAAQLQFEGILPYAPGTSTILMAPRKNQPLDLVCYYNAPNGAKYDFVWEWREVTSSSWTEIQRDVGVTISSTTPVTLKVEQFRPPAQDIMVRIAAYKYENDTVSEDVDKAMAVGFNYTVESYGEANTLQQEVYNLTTATGVTSWNGRLVVWGVPKDPTILFLSDYEDPSYFPYPNNIITFDSPIVHAEEFMGNLVVFTTNKLYQVTLSDDGTSWNSTVLQAHLYLSPWDRHLVQTVRNMLYFKSGNYYYMMVPKAYSSTGELTLAPVTNPITSFFDRFAVNINTLLKQAYDYDSVYELLTYYNILDYEDIHNIYVYGFNDPGNAVLNVDIIYNTVDRTWKIWVFESSNIMYPFKQDATQTGLLANTSLTTLNDVENETEVQKRLIQVYKWNKNSVLEFYIPSPFPLHYYVSTIFPYVSTGVVHLSGVGGSIEDGIWHINETVGYVDSPILHLASQADFFAGFSRLDLKRVLIDMYRNPDTYYDFLNHQFIDTGYRDDGLNYNKRYRELQIQINNLDTKDLSFGMEYVLDGSPRPVAFKYNSTQMIDEFDPDYGVVYVDSTPYLETELSSIDNTNQWTINQHLIPDITFWKVRVAISGKGSTPRLRLYSRNSKRFELISINWISRLMNMR